MVNDVFREDVGVSINVSGNVSRLVGDGSQGGSCADAYGVGVEVSSAGGGGASVGGVTNFRSVGVTANSDLEWGVVESAFRGKLRIAHETDKASVVSQSWCWGGEISLS